MQQHSTLRSSSSQPLARPLLPTPTAAHSQALRRCRGRNLCFKPIWAQENLLYGGRSFNSWLLEASSPWQPRSYGAARWVRCTATKVTTSLSPTPPPTPADISGRLQVPLVAVLALVLTALWWKARPMPPQSSVRAGLQPQPAAIAPPPPPPPDAAGTAQQPLQAAQPQSAALSSVLQILEAAGRRGAQEPSQQAEEPSAPAGETQREGQEGQEEEASTSTSQQQQPFIPVKDLGRIMLVARRAPCTGGGPAQDAYFARLLRGGVVGGAGGLLLLYRSCVLLVLEGGNNQVLSLLRRLSWDAAEQHGLEEPRVISFVLDARSRLFPSWVRAEVQGKEDGAAAAVMSEAQWASSVQEVEAFARGAGARLEGLSEATREQAMRNPAMFFGESTPTPRTLISLAAADLGPTIPSFLDAFDTDWPRYRQARDELDEAGAPPHLLAALPSWAMLHAVYGDVYDTQQQQLKTTSQHKEEEEEEASLAAQPTAPSPLAHLYPKPNPKQNKEG